MFYEIYPDPEDSVFQADLEAALTPHRPNVPIEGTKLMVVGVELRYNLELSRWYGSFRRHLDQFPVIMTRWSCNLVRIIKLDHPGLSLDEGPHTGYSGCTVYVENAADSAQSTQTITVEAPTLGEANRVYEELIQGPSRSGGLDAKRTAGIRACDSILTDSRAGHEAQVLAGVIKKILE